MTNQKFYDDNFVKSAVLEIARQMQIQNYRPHYIAGLTRGGLTPGVMLSHYLDRPLHPLDHDMSNLWMPEDAFGHYSDPLNILVIDDINDTGNTFINLTEDWKANCQPGNERWNTIWHNNVKFAALIHNEASDFESDYYGHTINKAENPEWCVFPWERWW